MEDRLRVGVITSPHGVRGEVKVYPTTDEKKRFQKLKKCFLVSGDKEVEAECTSCKYLKQMVVLKFAGIDSIEAAESFRQYDILVDRKDAVPLSEGEFFLCDVLGAAVYDQEDRMIGTLEDVLETPANYVFVIKKDGCKPVYVPVAGDWIEDVDTEKGIVRVHLYPVAGE